MISNNTLHFLRSTREQLGSGKSQLPSSSTVSAKYQGGFRSISMRRDVENWRVGINT